MFLLEVCSALNTADVDYAVVGGYAVALHGAVRGTMDVDIVVHLSEASFEATERALKSLGLSGRLPVTASQVSMYREEYIRERNLTAWSFCDVADPSRLVDIIITYDTTPIPYDTVDINGVDVRVLERLALIEMKRLAGRPQDLEDVRALESIES